MDYKIVEIRPLVDIAPDGRFIKIYRVRFEFNGIQDYVDIPEEEYSAENVKKIIEARVKEHEKLLKE